MKQVAHVRCHRYVKRPVVSFAHRDVGSPYIRQLSRIGDIAARFNIAQTVDG